MGLERLASVAQGKQSNFHTDLFAPLIDFVAAASRKPYGLDEKSDVSMRVVADHLRATTFLIGDGCSPRTRGAATCCAGSSGAPPGTARCSGSPSRSAHGVGVVVEAMQGAYPELATHLEFVRRVTRVEEERFTHTLEQGLGCSRR